MKKKLTLRGSRPIGKTVSQGTNPDPGGITPPLELLRDFFPRGVTKLVRGHFCRVPAYARGGWGKIGLPQKAGLGPKIGPKVFPQNKTKQNAATRSPHRDTSALLICRILFCFVLLAREGGRPAGRSKSFPQNKTKQNAATMSPTSNNLRIT